MVISGLSSLRGCALNFKFFSEVLEYGLPSWTVIQSWSKHAKDKIKKISHHL
jgi:hypothetical protein